MILYDDNSGIQTCLFFILRKEQSIRVTNFSKFFDRKECVGDGTTILETLNKEIMAIFKRLWTWPKLSDELIMFSKLSLISDHNSRCDTCVYLVANLSLFVCEFLVDFYDLCLHLNNSVWQMRNINLNEYHYNGCYDILLVTI